MSCALRSALSAHTSRSQTREKTRFRHPPRRLSVSLNPVMAGEIDDERKIVYAIVFAFLLRGHVLLVYSFNTAYQLTMMT